MPRLDDLINTQHDEAPDSPRVEEYVAKSMKMVSHNQENMNDLLRILSLSKEKATFWNYTLPHRIYLKKVTKSFCSRHEDLAVFQMKKIALASDINAVARKEAQSSRKEISSEIPVQLASMLCCYTMVLKILLFL